MCECVLGRQGIPMNLYIYNSLYCVTLVGSLVCCNIVCYWHEIIIGSHHEICFLYVYKVMNTLVAELASSALQIIILKSATEHNPTGPSGHLV